MNLIKFEDVYFSYNNTNVLENINLEINSGDYIYIIGENGSGKTTLLKGLLGLKKPDRGRIIFSDKLDRDEIGYIPQQKDIKSDFPASVFEIVLSGRLNKKRGPFYSRADREAARLNMEKLDIGDLKNRPYKFLSGGQQQRVLLARALCATEKILILDEPDTGLDPEAKEDLYDLLFRLNKNEKISILMVTHDIREDIRRGSKLVTVGDGNIEVSENIGDGND